MRGWLKPVFLGLGGAGLTILLILPLPIERSLDVFNLLLVAIAAIYVGFAISDGRASVLTIETAVALLFFLVILAGLWISPLWMVFGYFAHGAWDLAHHPKGIQTNVQRWYPPACAAYDWVVGAFILTYYL